MSGLYMIPLDLGDSVMDKSASYWRMFVGEKEPRKHTTTYIGGAKKKIVFNTGAKNWEHSSKYHPAASSNSRNPKQELAPQLAEAGVKPEDIDIVILTHLHWGHVGEVTKFPIQRVIERSIHPVKVHTHFFFLLGLVPLPVSVRRVTLPSAPSASIRAPVDQNQQTVPTPARLPDTLAVGQSCYRQRVDDCRE